MSKLTIHCQLNLPPWTDRFLARSGTKWLKVMDPGDERPLPSWDGNLIVRLCDSEEEQILTLQEVRRGDARSWFERHEARIRARPWLASPSVWLEHVNEPNPVADKGFCKGLDTFTADLARILWQECGVKSAGFCFSVGTPEVWAMKHFARGMAALRQYGGLWALHEYGWPAMNTGDGWTTLRYRHLVAELRRLGIAFPNIVITECGIDKLLINIRGGWRVVDELPEHYMEQLAWYDSEIMRDPYVVCATVFTATPNWQWLSYEVTEPLADLMARHIARTPTPEVQPSNVLQPGDKGFDASKYQTNINWELVKREGWKFVILRASGPNKSKDWTHIEKDPLLDSHYAGARSAGLRIGAYHYLIPKMDTQALAFRSACDGKMLSEGQFGDIECAGLTAEKCRLFLEACDRQFGSTTGVYTRASYFDRFGAVDWAKGRRLWVAHYGVSQPTLPKMWDVWDIHQHSDKGKVGGDWPVDLNVYKG